MAETENNRKETKRNRKEEIVTFKVDQALWEAMRKIPNRSEFIRSAILTALDSVCPLCQGTGTLTPDQRKHWLDFAQRHPIRQCDDCRAVHLICVAEDAAEGPSLGTMAAAEGDWHRRRKPSSQSRHN